MSKVKIKNLVKEIKYHNMRYWELNDPKITDEDYDELMEELRKLDPNNSLISQVNTVEISKDRPKVRFEEEMRSLDKEYSKEEIIKRLTKISRNKDEKFIASPKYDGCSAILMKDGVLASKGDGVEGFDISHLLPILKVRVEDETTTYNALYFNEIVQEECRGEILITKSYFDFYKDILVRKNGQPYKNERNACAGILATDDISKFNGEPILALVDFNRHTLKYTLDELINLDFEHLEDWVKGLGYPTDGIVFALADKEYSHSLGYTNHHPKGSIALKHTNPKANTKLLSIDWSVGKDSITPIGRIEPVEISGVTISNVNLHNMKNIMDLDLSCGDTVEIQRAGDVIPYLSKVIERNHDNADIVPPMNCPSCGDFCPACDSPTEYIEPELVCTNFACPGKIEVKIYDSVLRLGIDGLGRPTIKKMMNQLNVMTILDVIRLSENDLLGLEGFGERSAAKLYKNIQVVVNNGVEEWQILASLNFKGIGRSLSKDILSNISLAELREMDISVLELMDDIGDTRARTISDGLQFNHFYIDELLSSIKINETFRGETIKACLTGSFPEKKSFYEKDLAKYGIEFTKSVTKETNYCISQKTTTGKAKKAFKYGIPVMTIEDFYAMLCWRLNDENLCG